MQLIGHIALAVDSGLFILIWMVQLVVYPSFLFYTKKSLHDWHTVYTPRITAVVGPLMILQFIVSAIRLYLDMNWFSVLYLFLVLSAWLITFLIFIPIHERIQRGEYHSIHLQKLVKLNWMRTVLWSALLVLEVFLLGAK